MCPSSLHFNQAQKSHAVCVGLAKRLRGRVECEQAKAKRVEFTGCPRGVKIPPSMGRSTRENHKKFFCVEESAFKTVFGEVEEDWRGYTNEWGFRYFGQPRWKTLTKSEHYNFVNSLIAIGLRGHNGSIKDLFSNHIIYNHPAVASMFERDRFLDILRAWRPCRSTWRCGIEES